MFLPNTTGTLYRQTAKNLYGEPSFAQPRVVACGIVRLVAKAEKTSVRADSSASRGNADEEVTTSKILFPVAADPRIGDRFDIQGFVLRMIARHPRLSVYGHLDHYEVDLEHWEA
jgi:hypothetical protein